MKLPEFGVRRPVFTTVIFVGIILLGVVALSLLPIDLMPKMEIPTMSVITFYRGASAEDIETKITKVIEAEVSTTPNIKEVTSTSQEDLSVVTMQFEWGTDLNEAANAVRQRLDFAGMRLPDDAEKPMLFKMDVSMMPVVVFGVTAEQSYTDLHDIMDNKFCDPLKRIPGVAMTLIMGGLQREIQVNIDRQRLEAYHLSVPQVTRRIAAENFSLPAGDLKIGRTDYIVRVPGEFQHVEEINDVVVGTFNGTPIHLRDVANVKDAFKDIDRRVRINRGRGMIVMVQKQSGANTVTVVNRIKKVLPKLKKKLPPDVKVVLAMDSSEFIVRSINNLASTVGWALLFVVLVVFFFLREIRGSFIIAVTIPVSLIVAFAFLYAGGYTINMMSLSAIAIAIGMVVDNAIVIYENCYRHRTEGESRREAAMFGAGEVGTAVMASTFTTVAIFFAIIFVKGITGIMFRELGLVVMIVLAASLFSALTLTPMLSSQFMRVPSPGEERKGFIRRFHDFSETWFTGLEAAYRKLLNGALNHRKITVAVGLGVFVGSLFLFKVVGTEFMPTMDQGEVQGTVKLPVGTRVEATDQVMNKIEQIMEKEVPERELIFARCGKSETGMGAVMGQQSDTHIIMVYARLMPKSKRNRSDRDIARSLSQKISRIPGVQTIDFAQQDMMTQMTGGGAVKPVSVEIYGHDIAKTDAVALKIKKFMDTIPGLTDVTISREKGKPELWVVVDRPKAASLGLNMYQIAHTLRTKFYGQVVTKYREAGEEYDTFVRLKGSDRQRLADLEHAFVTSPLGQQIPIQSIARIVERRGPLTIERKDQERIVRVEGSLYKRSLGKVVADIKRELAKISIPEGMDVEIGGSAQDQAESFRWLGIAFLFGIILVYMVMAAQFESFLDPFVILFSIPFAVVGVIWALCITGKTFNTISFVGVVMLVGIVVNNAIVLVDYINIMRARGLALFEAVLVSGPRRLRPVLMTAFTTIFALLPLALGTGEGSEVWSPLAISVIGGLLISTLVTLIFVPVMYSILETKVKKNRSR